MIGAFDAFFLSYARIFSASLASLLSIFADPETHLVLWGIFSFFLFWRKKKEALFCAPVHLFGLTCSIMFVCGVLKVIVGRARPLLLEVGISGFHPLTVHHDYLSFPSSHCAVAVALSLFLQKRYNLKPYVYLFPVLIAISRLSLMKHFASDVVAGCVIGFLCSKGFSKCVEYIQQRKRLRG